jgi:RNA polymerase sigma-70 factor, ECF subfamily
METLVRNSLRRWLTWLQGKPAGVRCAQPCLETLEDRTGLSAVPATHIPVDTDVIKPLFVDVIADHPDEQPPTSSDHSTAPPGSLDQRGNDHFEYDPTTSIYPQGQTDQPLVTGKQDQPTTFGDPPRSLDHQPLIQAITRFDNLKQTLRSSLTSPEAATSSADAYFQIQRTPATQQPLEVQYEVKAFTRTSVEALQQTARFAAGADKIDVMETPLTLRQQRDVEIITLTLHEQKQYQVARPGATIFVAQHQQHFSEAALLRAVQEGQSSEALSRLVEMHRSRVVQACYQVLGNFADAEDASQLVFMMFAQQHFKLQQTVGRWLHAVARNVAISFLRSRQRRKRHEMNAMKSDIAASLGQFELKEELTRALNQLPPQLKQAVQLRYLEGWSQNEVAEFLNCPRGTVAQRAARGLQALRKVMVQ